MRVLLAVLLLGVFAFADPNVEVQVVSTCDTTYTVTCKTTKITLTKTVKADTAVSTVVDTLPPAKAVKSDKKAKK